MTFLKYLSFKSLMQIFWIQWFSANVHLSCPKVQMFLNPFPFAKVTHHGSKYTWLFGRNLTKKVVSWPKQGKWIFEPSNHWIQHILISLGTKFHLNHAIFIFWTKFAQKEICCPKEEVSISSSNSKYSN